MLYMYILLLYGHAPSRAVLKGVGLGDHVVRALDWVEKPTL